jgi:hypothetical protein
MARLGKRRGPDSETNEGIRVTTPDGTSELEVARRRYPEAYRPIGRVEVPFEAPAPKPKPEYKSPPWSGGMIGWNGAIRHAIGRNDRDRRKKLGLF